MMPMRRLSGGMSKLPSKRVSPFSWIRPLSGLSRPAIMLTRVDLPLPDGPKTPVLKWDMATSISRSKLPNRFCRTMRSSMSIHPDHAPAQVFVKQQHQNRNDHGNQTEQHRHGIAVG